MDARGHCGRTGRLGALARPVRESPCRIRISGVSCRRGLGGADCRCGDWLLALRIRRLGDESSVRRAASEHVEDRLANSTWTISATCS